MRRLGPIELRYRRERLGRRGVCPFCGYIGPPLLCGCVSHMLRALDLARSSLEHHGAPSAITVQIENAVADQRERVRILNDALRMEQ